MQTPSTRREFLQFLGHTGLTLGAMSSLGSLIACASTAKSAATSGPWISPSFEDSVRLAQGLEAPILISSRQSLGIRDALFGATPDYLHFMPDPRDSRRALLWSNHESPEALLTHGEPDSLKKTKLQIDLERKSVGGSILTLRREDESASWKFVPGAATNRRLDAFTKIPFAGFSPHSAESVATGTFGNCAGGFTPWGTVLTCEENYQDYTGEVTFENGRRSVKIGKFNYGWHRFYELPPENYGWVVEVDPQTGRAKKLTGLGRFAHECATVVESPDGRVVVYSGDDNEDCCLYKFVAEERGSLEKGKLYAADTVNGRWLPLDLTNVKLKERFKTQENILIFAREAALLAGATPLDRPEDVEHDPVTGAIFVSLTNNKKRNNFFGSILKIEENARDVRSLEFRASTFIAGSPEIGFACPDNLAFDPNGNLWFTTDISGSSIGKPPYEPFGNNGLFVVPRSGPEAGRALRVATAPKDAEFTGPTFTPDGRTLFLSVQHPGELSRRPGEYTSHWPDGGDAMPRSAVLQIRGPLLEQLSAKKLGKI